ncbi:MAG: hypothetical protein NT069_21680 [Planctomycetota bacterium]|nr:hypothetical protein [Planctomycetota bacterium]
MPALIRCLSLVTILFLAPALSAGDLPLAVGHAVSVEVLLIESPPGGERVEIEESMDPAAILARARELQKQRKPVTITRVRLSTLENIAATVQTGETAAVETGRQFRGGPRGDTQGFPVVPVFSHQQFGTVVSATPRIEEEGTILLELSLERSALARAPTSDDRAKNPTDTPAIPRTVTLKTQATLRLNEGETQLVQGIDFSSEDNATETVVLVTARFVQDAKGPLGKNPPAAAGRTPQLQIFRLKTVDPQSVKLTISELLPQSKVSMAADERTNSLIVNGSSGDLKLIGELINELDQSPKKPN